MSSTTGGFLWQMYSICTVEVGTTSCSRAFFASCSAVQVASIPASSNGQETHSTLLFTLAAIDLISSASRFSPENTGSSMAEMPSLSNSLAISIFSLKLRERAVLRVTSEQVTVCI